MLITTHALVTLAVGKVIGLEGPELYTALAAGIGVDIDHLLVNRKWMADVRAFLQGEDVKKGTVNQHSWLQEVLVGSIIGIIVGVLVAFFIPFVRWWIVPLFLLMHIGLDAVMKFEHRPFAPLSTFVYRGWVPSATKNEVILSSIGLLLVIFSYL